MEFGYEPLTSLLKFEEYLTKGIELEQAYSYLLLNSGYLTVRMEDNRYFFKIPNFEAREDFALVIEEEIQESINLAESSYGKFLLKSHDKLEPNKYREAVDLIINGDKV